MVRAFEIHDNDDVSGHADRIAFAEPIVDGAAKQVSSCSQPYHCYALVLPLLRVHPVDEYINQRYQNRVKETFSNPLLSDTAWTAGQLCRACSGLYEHLTTVSFIIFFCCQVGLPNALRRFIPLWKDPRNQNGPLLYISLDREYYAALS